MKKKRELIRVVEVKTQSGRVFTPPDAGEKLKARIKARMGNPTVGAEKKFAQVTGLPYGSLRQWISRPIIPFLLAEFIAVWLRVDLRTMMNWGVRITVQMRRNSIVLKAPDLKILQDESFQLIADLIEMDGYSIVYESDSGKKTCVPSAKLPEGSNIQRAYYEAKDVARQLVEEYTILDTKNYPSRS